MSEDPYPPPEQALMWVLESVDAGGRIASVRPLRGEWHADHAIDVLDRTGLLHRLVLRRWARPEREASDLDFTADREATVLELLGGTPVPAPRLVAADPTGAHFDVPALLITRLVGNPPARPTDMDSFLRQLASALPLIHAVNGGAQAAVPGYRRYYEPEGLAVPAWLPASTVWERASDVVGGPEPAGPSCFIHRDYHPGNTEKSRPRRERELSATEARIQKTKEPLDRYFLAFEEGKLREEICSARIEELSGKLASLEARRADLVEEISGSLPEVLTRGQLAELRQEIRQSLTDGPLPERKAAMQAVVAEIKVRDRATSSRSFACRFSDHRMDRCPRRDTENMRTGANCGFRSQADRHRDVQGHHG